MILRLVLRNKFYNLCCLNAGHLELLNCWLIRYRPIVGRRKWLGRTWQAKWSLLFTLCSKQIIWARKFGHWTSNRLFRKLIAWEWWWHRNCLNALEGPLWASTNLKFGTGCPWAGQFKLRAKLFWLNTINPLVLELNFGREPPIGSSKVKMFSYWPIARNWGPLSWTLETKRLTLMSD